MSDIITTILLIGTDEGGRSQAIPAANFGCPVYFKDIPELGQHAYDCRLLLAEYGRPLVPGTSSPGVGVAFLSEADVVPFLSEGTEFTLWEGRPIGTGTVTKVGGSPSS